jgi:hypothetical protein
MRRWQPLRSTWRLCLTNRCLANRYHRCYRLSMSYQWSHGGHLGCSFTYMPCTPSFGRVVPQDTTQRPQTRKIGGAVHTCWSEFRSWKTSAAACICIYTDMPWGILMIDVRSFIPDRLSTSRLAWRRFTGSVWLMRSLIPDWVYTSRLAWRRFTGSIWFSYNIQSTKDILFFKQITTVFFTGSGLSALTQWSNRIWVSWEAETMFSGLMAKLLVVTFYEKE